MKRHAFAAAAVAASATAAGAQVASDGTVVIGGLIPLGTPTYSQAYSIDIVSEEELEEAGDIPLADYLARRAGISFTRNGPIGGTANLRVRGLDDQYLTVRIDGIDVTDPSGPQMVYDFGQITTSGISRIEILKGSQSAAFGSEAVAGVINIVTARAEEDGPSAEVEVEAGTYGTYRGSLTTAYRDERVELAFNVSRITTDGFSAQDENDGNDEADGFDQTRMSVSGSYRLTDAVTLGLSAFASDSEAEFDEFGGDGTPDEVVETDQRGARIYAEVYALGIDHNFAVTRYDIDRTSRSNGNEDTFEGDRLGATYTGAVDLTDRATLAFGAEWTREEFQTDGAEGDETTSGVFGEVLFQATPQAELALALRYDSHSDFDDVVSGRAALAFDLPDGLTLRAVAATGFRAPSLYERFDPVFGNEDLEPEESRSLEFGVEKRFSRGEVEATVFYTEIDELIGFGDSTYVQVPGTSRTRGIELEASYDVTDRIGLFGNYTYTDAEDAEGERLLRVPRHDVALGLEALLTERLSGRFLVRHVSDQVDAIFPPPTFAAVPVDLDDYTVADASLTYAFDARAEAYLRVENLFDEEYQTALGFGTSDRAVYAGIRASF